MYIIHPLHILSSPNIVAIRGYIVDITNINVKIEELLLEHFAVPSQYNYKYMRH